MFELESNIREWSDNLRLRGNLKETDILELENHLRDEIEDFLKAGLSEDEAFLISVKRLGSVDKLSMEYSKVNTEKLWKNLFSAYIDPDRREKKPQGYFACHYFLDTIRHPGKNPRTIRLSYRVSGIRIVLFQKCRFFHLAFYRRFFCCQAQAEPQTGRRHYGHLSHKRRSDQFLPVICAQ